MHKKINYLVNVNLQITEHLLMHCNFELGEVC